MDSFNLIPNEYRAAQAKARAVIKWSSAAVSILVITAVTLVVANNYVSDLETDADALRMKKAVSAREQARLTELRKQKQGLESQVLLLDSLRSGAPVDELIQTVERAVKDTRVRFVSWQFRRAGIVVADDAEVRAPSYFVLAKDAAEFPREWHALTHMTIHGHAGDHAALSEFVQRLYEHPTVDDVKVQRSIQENDGVRFNLAVIVKTLGSVS